METKHQSPAEVVIARFKGVRRLARMLGVHPSTVCRWNRPISKGGTGGLVPSRMQVAILNLAKRDGKVKIKASDLVGEPTVEPANKE